ncbi:hypothetical protein [Glaciihabitans sp. dw_435]|uniref:hypothetical protein n=1 Tax=Glaciihabitans sp. dw_435 TaxID=2720081 RepID=UPI001BD2539E|nr:hypothetical protein [Glaciihabitans sp. dw_435]
MPISVSARSVAGNTPAHRIRTPLLITLAASAVVAVSLVVGSALTPPPAASATTSDPDPMSYTEHELDGTQLPTLELDESDQLP